MAFKARCEYWALSALLGEAVLLETTIADADEHTAAVEAADLPAAPANNVYALSVFGVEGNCVVAVGPDVDDDPTDSGRLVTEGSQHWFKVKKGDKVSVIEYA